MIRVLVPRLLDAIILTPFAEVEAEDALPGLDQPLIVKIRGVEICRLVPGHAVVFECRGYEKHRAEKQGDGNRPTSRKGLDTPPTEHD